MGINFSASLLGLQATSQAISVAGNNIANSNTVGYKQGVPIFADFFNSRSGTTNGAGNSLQIGSGVTLAAVEGIFSQGSVTDSAEPTHIAIQGNGFFVVNDQASGRGYTRAGAFSLDRNGYLVTPQGARVQGFSTTDANGNIVNNGILGDLRLPIGSSLPPTATSEVALRANLDASAADATTFNTQVRIFDSLGAEHTLNFAFTRSTAGDAAGPPATHRYNLAVTLDGSAAPLANSTGGSPIQINFDSAGKLVSPATLSLNAQTVGGGATIPAINIPLNDTNGSLITGFAAPSAVASSRQNGFRSSSVTSVSALTIDNTGLIIARFDNGQSRQLGQVALATFDNPQGLLRSGNSIFNETTSSGLASVGVAGTGGRGYLQGNALEQSNVDLATEFTQLIVAQRGFQANARAISSTNQALQDILQLI